VDGGGRDIPESLSDLCHPHRLALVVYDMQVGVLSQLSDADEIVAKVVDVLEAARAGGYPIFFLRHMFLPNRLKGLFGLRRAMAWQQVDSPSRLEEFLLRDSPEFALTPEMSPRADEAILDKITMSAFEGTPLAMALRDLGVRAFAIVGVALEVGIEPTVRHAIDIGLIPVVVSDACGGRDQSAMDRALAGFAFEGSSVLTQVATIVELLRQTPDAPAITSQQLH
jgi:nicotinamidase-related amidase